MKGLKFKSRSQSIPDYVDTLDGFRALATFLVLIFHYWQQSWNTMELRFGSFTVNFGHIVSNGYLGVELLFILSGFCLYYPLAMHPDRRLSIGNYIYKRVVRILPTYLLCVMICSAYQIGRLDPHTLREQFIGNMTLTQMTTAALSYNQINGVLWSIAIEVQFYILFPILLPLFRRKPYGVMAAAFIIGEVWRWYLRDIDHSQINWLMNQLPGMIDCFVGGMLAAKIAAQLKRDLVEPQRAGLAQAFTAGTLAFMLVVLLVMMYIDALRYNDLPDNLSRMQMNTRKFVIVGFAGAMLCSIFASTWLRKVFGNPITRFISAISYQVYMWHMWIALRLKDFHIPEYVTERPMDDTAWRFPYLMLSLAVSLVVAIAMTYLIERPISRFAMKHMPRWAKPRKPKEVREPKEATANE